MFKWIQKKDLVYWLIIIIIVSLLSSDIGQTKRLVLDNWAFAGTVVSIILAVIAILYTFDQSSTTVASTKKLEESANRVEDATKELENNNVSMVIADLEEKLEKIIKEMQHGINENISSNIKSFFNTKNDRLSVDKNIQILSEEEWDKYLNSVLIEDVEAEGMALIYSYFLFEKKLVYSDEVTKKWVKTFSDSEFQTERFLGIFNGQIRLYASLNVFDFKIISEDPERAKFIYFNEVVYEKVKSIIEKEEIEDINILADSIKKSLDIN